MYDRDTVMTRLDEYLDMANGDILISGYGDLVVSEAMDWMDGGAAPLESLTESKTARKRLDRQMQSWNEYLLLAGSTAMFTYAPDRPRSVTDLQIQMYAGLQLSPMATENLLKEMFPDNFVNRLDAGEYEVEDFAYSPVTIQKLRLVAEQMKLVEVGGLHFGGLAGVRLLESAEDGMVGAFQSKAEAEAKAAQMVKDGYDPTELYIYWATNSGGKLEANAVNFGHDVMAEAEPVVLGVRYKGAGYGEESQFSSRQQMAGWLEADRIPEKGEVVEVLRYSVGDIEIVTEDVYDWLDKHGSSS